MLPDNCIEKLRSSLNFCFDDAYDSEKEIFTLASTGHKNYYSENLGLKNIDSSFISFYAVVAFPPLGRGEELYTIDSIFEENNPDDKDENLPGEIGERYLRFTSIEGEGSYYYDVETDAVYDVSWGEEEDMVSGDKAPWFTSFYDFLEWYYS